MKTVADRHRYVAVTTSAVDELSVHFYFQRLLCIVLSFCDCNYKQDRPKSRSLSNAFR